MAPRLIFISDHNSHGQRLARVLATRGIALDAVLVETGGLISNGGIARGLRSLASLMKRRWRFYRQQKPFYRSLSARILPSGEMNSAAMLAHLGSLAPDYIIVGSGKILRNPVIETARCGVLNVHPALLPWVRGSGVVGHALQQQVPIGATLHFIDAGIDTGAIIERRLLPITGAQTTLRHLEEAAGELAAQIMADWVEKIIHSGEKPPATPQTTRFPLFKWPEASSRGVLNELCKTGRALELFKSWEGLTNGAPEWVLPADWMEGPFSLQGRESV